MQALTPQSPPPAAIDTRERDAYVTSHPVIVRNGVAYRVFAMNLTGDHDTLESARKKLAAEGWQGYDMRDRDHTAEVLIFDTSGKSEADVVKLQNRVDAHEFGKLGLRYFLAPNPSIAK